ncbi:ABC transporter ATP-binding protein [Actinokineospora auranticolor]|uniref:Putative ABC transport system ATP-binding protein n=1 Tax=Actinokineospora auranticolor TaxID=155976 RepID=A0A2S6GC79_9PSEU|nr:ABC transporter ATP-binding protein [Actinokineospora auranticolor]PPK61753.1 putative ABC transport system ATP-binding protein [Actinokineospora auranticolor]
MTRPGAVQVAAQPVMALRGCGLTYPGETPVHAVRPVDLVINQGDHVAIIGPSGSGKSTLLNILGLLDRPTEGTYELTGIATGELSDVARAGLRSRKLGFVFQAFHLIAHRTAEENVMLGLLYGGTPRRLRRGIAREALARVGLSHRVDAVPARMSGGERQRVAIARALAVRPALLLCDEPTGNLDSANAGAVLSLVGDLNADGMTIVTVTHDTAVARRAGRTLTMRDGHLTESGRPQDTWLGTGHGIPS